MVKICSHQESTIDYPGKMGEILFVSGCNFKCGFCHNPELVSGKLKEIDTETLLKNLGPKIWTGWYQGITISGGEPTIYSDLPEFMRRLKKTGLSVKLDTNGSNPKMLKELLEEKLVDYVAMDVKSPREKYPEVVKDNVKLGNIDESIELVKLFPEYEFRTTILPFFESCDFESIGKWVTDGGHGEKVRQYTLQQFNPKKTMEGAYGKLIPKSPSEIKKFEKIMNRYAKKVRVLA